MKKLLGFVLMLGLFSTQTFANEQYSLQKAKEAVVNDNINVSIAYENYVMVKNQAQVKTLQLLPSLTVDMLIYDYQYTILRSIIPEPSKFFDVAAAKDMAKAADVNRTIVKKNLLADLETTIFLFQFHKEMVASFQKELDMRTEIAKRSQEAYDLGSISFDDYYTSQRAVVEAKTQYISGVELVKTEEFALKLILQVPDNTAALDIDQTDFYNSTLNFPQDTNSAMNIAANNSKEIEQFDYLIQSAQNTKHGVALSWISWNGVGFDYFARVSVAKSQVTVLQLQKTKAAYEVKNQVATMYDEIAKHKEKMGYQDQLLAMAQAQYDLAVTNNNAQLETAVNVSKAELSLMSAQRDSRRLQYELELKYIKLKRLLGANMITNEVPRS